MADVNTLRSGDVLSSVNLITKHSDVLLAVGVIAILGIIIVPMPTAILDVLLALNITLALVILMVALYTTEPLEFSVFPGLLLLVTLYRLSLNVASTRLILGDAFAGEVITAFGTFVVKGNYIVGFVMFVILVVIQFVVITKGATRIAEVAARFTLDAMPGKQMSIDADLNAGLIDDVEARRRREKVSRESDFYGAMDGASKFVRGDAVAGLAITFINILGGFVIGILQRGMSLTEALRTYTILTVGDGLVSQIPALVLSTSAGIIVTRAASESNLGQDVTRQILFQPKAILITACVLFLLGLTPGLPGIPFFLLSVITGAIGYTASHTKQSLEEREVAETEEEEESDAEQRPEDLLTVDPIAIEIGYGLICLVDAEQGGDLLERIRSIRRQCAAELGIVIPQIRIRDNFQLESNEYVIKLRGIEVVGGAVRPGYYMAMDSGMVEEKIEGIEITDPTFGLPAVWIRGREKERAELAGYTVVEAPAVLATHLMETLREHADRVLGRHDVQKLVDRLREEYPSVVDGVIPAVVSLGTLHRVLQNMLREQVPIRDLMTILETLADNIPIAEDPVILTEYVRRTLSWTICTPLQDEEGTIVAAPLGPEAEQVLKQAVESVGQENVELAIPPEVIQGLYGDLASKIEAMVGAGRPPVVICSPAVRRHFRRLVEVTFPKLVVLSYGELPPNIRVESVGMVSVATN